MVSVNTKKKNMLTKNMVELDLIYNAKYYKAADVFFPKVTFDERIAKQAKH